MLPALRRRLAGSEAALVLRDDLRPAAGHPGPGHPDLHPHLHRRLPGRRPGVDRPAAALVHGRDHRHPGGADLAAAATTCCGSRPSSRSARRAASSTTSCGCRRPTSASASPARSARASQINDDVAKIIGGRLATTTIDSVLTIFYATLMFLYDAKLTLAVLLLSASQHRRGQGCQPRPHRRQPAPQAGPRQAAGHGDERSPDDRDPQGDRLRGRVLRAAGPATTPSRSTPRSSSACSARSAARCRRSCRPRSTAAVLVLGGLKVMHGDLTVGMLVAYQTLLGSFTRPLASFVNFSSSLQELQADMNRLDDVLRYPPTRSTAIGAADDGKDGAATGATASRRSAGDHPPPGSVKLSGRVELRDVTFGYSPLEQPLIAGLQPDRRARPPRRACRRQRQRQVDGGQARLRPLRAVGRRDPVRRRAAPEPAARSASSTRWPWSTRRCSCSAARSPRTSRCGTRPSPRRASSRRRATPPSTR